MTKHDALGLLCLLLFPLWLYLLKLGLMLVLVGFWLPLQVPPYFGWVLCDLTHIASEGSEGCREWQESNSQP